MDYVELEEDKKDLGIELKRRLIGEKNKISYGELMKNNLPTFFKSYLRSLANRIYDTQNPIQVNEKLRYDFSLNEKIIEKLLNQLKDVVIESTIFKLDEIEKAINKIVSLQLNIFIMPRKALLDIFYKTKKEHSKRYILQVVSNISNGSICTDHLLQILKGIQNNIITREHFLQILQDTEKEIYHNESLEPILRDITAMADYMGQLMGKPCRQIKKAHIFTMLQERGLNSLAQRFKNEEIERNPDSSPFINVAEIEKRLKKYFLNEEEDKPKAPFISSPPQEILDKILPHFDVAKIRKQTKEVLDSTDESENNETFENKSELVNKEESTRIKKNKIVETKPTKVERETQQKIRYVVNQTIKNRREDTRPSRDDSMDYVISHSIIESQPEGPISTLKTLIDPKSKKLFIKKIFRKDESAYHNFIEKLEITETWKKAKHLIDEELSRRGVEPFSKEAIRLGDLVFGRYFPKDQIYQS